MNEVKRYSMKMVSRCGVTFDELERDDEDGEYMLHEDHIADLAASNARVEQVTLNAQIFARWVYTELATLVAVPSDPDFSVACPNSSDAECLEFIYSKARGFLEVLATSSPSPQIAKESGNAK